MYPSFVNRAEGILIAETTFLILKVRARVVAIEVAFVAVVLKSDVISPRIRTITCPASMCLAWGAPQRFEKLALMTEPHSLAQGCLWLGHSFSGFLAFCPASMCRLLFDWR